MESWNSCCWDGALTDRFVFLSSGRAVDRSRAFDICRQLPRRRTRGPGAGCAVARLAQREDESEIRPVRLNRTNFVDTVAAARFAFAPSAAVPLWREGVPARSGSRG
jgi:hypothetical protein